MKFLRELRYRNLVINLENYFQKTNLHTIAVFCETVVAEEVTVDISSRGTARLLVFNVLSSSSSSSSISGSSRPARS
jgi:hypothetical protein